jgi:hypothetical protein
MAHWTKHAARLTRDFGRKQWGDEGYAKEELVAELGASFLCADLELAIEPREDNTCYIAHWLEILKSVFKAAAHAQRAAEYLRSFRGKQHRHRRAGRLLRGGRRALSRPQTAHLIHRIPGLSARARSGSGSRETAPPAGASCRRTASPCYRK